MLSFSIINHLIRYSYCLNNLTITGPVTFRELGITFHNKLTFSYHINSVAADGLRA